MPEFKFKIRNIKCYGDQPEEIVLNLDSRKLNFVVAPNGIGKTSFTTAFSCLKDRKIDVPQELKHKKQRTATVSLSIENEGVEWVANGRSNKITPEWNPVVINSRIQSGVNTMRGERGAVVNEAVMKVMSICVRENVPARITFPYNFQEIKVRFGAKKEALRDYTDIINTPRFMSALKKSIPCLYQFNNYRVPKSRIDQLVGIINGKEGNVRTLKHRMTVADFKTIEQYKNYKTYKEAFKSILGENADKLDYFLLFYQLCRVYETHADIIKDAILWADYEFYKHQFEMDLACVKCPWKGALLREQDNKLFIDYPLVDEFSNGQRDIMTLYTQLLLFKRNLSEGKKYILIMDEVFDYLDDANLLAAQYFVSSLLDNNARSTIYVILFTHLDPKYYRTYVLKKIINVQYLNSQQPIPNKLMKHFIGYRDWLKREGEAGDADKMQLYKDISNYLFHYHPEDCDYRGDIRNNQHPRPARESWGKKDNLYSYLIDEINKYLGGLDYDPYAVAFAVRVRVEKIVYDQIGVEDVKREFLNVNLSYDKIDVCERHHIQIPLFYMMVIAIGNEADHMVQKDDEYQEKEMVYKLKNNIIKKIISDIFDYSGEANPILLDSLYP